jgi:hypothetical protein
MTTLVQIDPNVRVHGNDTYAGMEEVVGPVAVGAEVRVTEPESGLVGWARVTHIDAARDLVYLALDWASLAPAPPEEVPQPPSMTVALESGLNVITFTATGLVGPEGVSFMAIGVVGPEGFSLFTGGGAVSVGPDDGLDATTMRPRPTGQLA